VSWPESPSWLVELQQRFGALLRTPLDRSTGALRAETSAYEAELLAAARPTSTLSSAERLATYHRQYWFRLFTVLQRQYPLTARLVGYWRFNEFAARHLVDHPPRGFDIDAVGHGFAETLARLLPEGGRVESKASRQVDVAAVLEAARIDAAFHLVARAPLLEPFRPTAEDAPRLASSRFVLSPGVALLSEHWPLSERRLGLVEPKGDDAVELSEPLRDARHWLLARHQTKLGLEASLKLGLLALEPAEAKLLRLLQQHPLEQALGLLEAAASDAERVQLPARAQAWLARSVQLGVWSGLADP
jgi:Putative DNA-binding domain